MQNAKTQALREQISALVEQYAAVALRPEPFLPGVTMVPPSGKLLDADELNNMVEAYDLYSGGNGRTGRAAHR